LKIVAKSRVTWEDDPGRGTTKNVLVPIVATTGRRCGDLDPLLYHPDLQQKIEPQEMIGAPLRRQ
jgi:hypothetical protein